MTVTSSVDGEPARGLSKKTRHRKEPKCEEDAVLHLSLRRKQPAEFTITNELIYIYILVSQLQRQIHLSLPVQKPKFHVGKLRFACASLL